MIHFNDSEPGIFYFKVVMYLLVYTNHCGSAHDLTILHDRRSDDPFMIETANGCQRFRTIEELLSHLERNGFTSSIGARMIEEKIRTALSGCQHFPGRKCRGCEYASHPDEFDPFCMYDRDEEMQTVDEVIDR